MLSSGKAHSSGLSLPEVLISAALALLLLGVLIQTLLPALRYSTEGTVRVELQQAGFLALQRIAADLQKTTAAGVSYKSAPIDALAINTIADIDSEGHRVWSDALHVYGLDASGEKLVFKTVAASQAAAFFPQTLGPAEVANLVANQGPEQRTLAFQVKMFEITPYRPATSSQSSTPTTLHLVLEKKLPRSSKPARIDLSRSVFLRNS